MAWFSQRVAFDAMSKCAETGSSNVLRRFLEQFWLLADTLSKQQQCGAAELLFTNEESNLWKRPEGGRGGTMRW